MRELVFALEFRGRGGPVAGSTTKRQARTTAPSQALRTVLGPSGVRADIDPVPGESAVLESRVERFPDGSFVEDGTITYGRAGSISFDTVGRGQVGPAAGGSGSHGVVMWRVTGGEGRFAGAQGLITSNFTVSPDGEVIDDHFTRLYLPQ
ncbi:MAG TPA: hypothetical protein VFS98_03725 [Methylomirabilota bacterium]|jgi:hypothetical protein|nr:hypothetical protein [Methylomirabilota bacterium]